MQRWMLLRPDALADFITGEFDIALAGTVAVTEDGESVRLLPSDIPRTRSFQIEFLFGWRSLRAHFTLAGYARELADNIHSASPEQRATFRRFVEAIRSHGGDLKIQVGGVDATEDVDSWPSLVPVEHSLWKAGVMMEDGFIQPSAVAWIRRFVGLCLSLLPLETSTTDHRNGEEEGREFHVYVKRYERSRVNRALCLDAHGSACAVCSFDFGRVYGDVGAGFIHVHHLEPVSMMGDSYVLDPVKDLRPVCPNCHAMLHRRRPPFSISELQDILVSVRAEGDRT